MEISNPINAAEFIIDKMEVLIWAIASGDHAPPAPCGSDDPDRLPPSMLQVYNLSQTTADGVLM